MMHVTQTLWLTWDVPDNPDATTAFCASQDFLFGQN